MRGAHNAIRFDMDNFWAAIRKTKEQVGSQSACNSSHAFPPPPPPT